MRPKGTVMGMANRQQNAPAPLLDAKWAPNAPPLCQSCWTARHRAGSFISRLIFRPGVLLRCLDCGVTIFDDRPKKRVA